MMSHLYYVAAGHQKLKNQNSIKINRFANHYLPNQNQDEMEFKKSGIKIIENHLVQAWELEVTQVQVCLWMLILAVALVVLVVKQLVVRDWWGICDQEVLKGGYLRPGISGNILINKCWDHEMMREFLDHHPKRGSLLRIGDWLTVEWPEKEMF